MYSKESNSQTHLQSEVETPEAEQILHLKRLLVTLKQHYEKSLKASQIQLQVEQNQRIAIQNEMRNLQAQLADRQKLYEEDVQALGNQQVFLKELLKKSQDDFRQAKQREDELKTIFSSTSSQHIKQEIEGMKLGLAQEIKALENRYIEILNEKIGLEHQCKQLQLKIDHQSSNLTSFQMQMHRAEDEKQIFETALRVKEAEFSESFKKCQDLQNRICVLDERVLGKEFVQDKYEQLKDEWTQLGERLEENIELRTHAEKYAARLEASVSEQEVQLKEYTQELQILSEEKKNLESDKDQLKTLLNESEMRLKIAQQHLAKKVKESTLLNERVEVLQIDLKDFTQTMEQQKNQLMQLQASVDLHQKQEKRLQEQLNEALKGAESQVAKWEEKYFQMYDKWQESEKKIHDLKLIEEKHHQMQNMLANIGNFMGNSNVSNGSFQPGKESIEGNLIPHSFNESSENDSINIVPRMEPDDEKYDLFGMRQSQDKYKTDLSA